LSLNNKSVNNIIVRLVDASARSPGVASDPNLP